MIVHHLYRARLALLGAVLFAVVVVAVEFPFSMLFHQRNQLQLVSSQLNHLQQTNQSLQSDVSALSQNSTIAEIAHEEYGLVQPGQLAYVILPGAGHPADNGLTAAEIPPRDLVATTPGPTAAGHTSKPAGPGLWRRFVSHLEFWKSAG